MIMWCTQKYRHVAPENNFGTAKARRVFAVRNQSRNSRSMVQIIVSAPHKHDSEHVWKRKLSHQDAAMKLQLEISRANDMTLARFRCTQRGGKVLLHNVSRTTKKPRFLLFGIPFLVESHNDRREEVSKKKCPHLNLACGEHKNHIGKQSKTARPWSRFFRVVTAKKRSVQTKMVLACLVP